MIGAVAAVPVSQLNWKVGETKRKLLFPVAPIGWLNSTSATPEDDPAQTPDAGAGPLNTLCIVTSVLSELTVLPCGSLSCQMRGTALPSVADAFGGVRMNV